MKPKFFLLLFLSLMSPLLMAQETVFLSKSEALTAVTEGNLSIKIAEKVVEGAQSDYQQTSAVVLPEIGLSFTGFTTTNPLMAFGSRLNQEVITTADFDSDLLNDPDRINNYATSIDIMQPLINVDGIYQRKAAKNKMYAIELQAQRTKDHQAFEVELAYMQLQLAHKSKAVVRSALNAALANKEIAKDNFQQGLLHEADVLEVDIRVGELENKLIQAESDIQNISNKFSLLMGLDSDVIYIPTDSLRINNIVANDSQISTERSDIKAMQMVSDAYLASAKASKMAFLPRLNAFGSYQLYDNEIFQGGADGYLVGAQLSWTILEGSKRFAEKQKSETAFQKSQLEYDQYLSQNKIELKKAQRMHNTAKNRIALADLAWKQATESLRIRRNRFKEGLEKSADLLQSESLVSEKELNYYHTIYEHNYAVALITYLTKKN